MRELSKIPATSSLYSREKSSVYCTLLTRNSNCRVNHPGISAETIFGALLFNPGCRADTVLFWALYYSVCNICIAVLLCVLYSACCVREWLGCTMWNFFTVATVSSRFWVFGVGQAIRRALKLWQKWMFPFLCAFSRQFHVVEIDVQKYIIFDMPVYRVHRLRQIWNLSEVPIPGIYFFSWGKCETHSTWLCYWRLLGHNYLLLID